MFALLVHFHPHFSSPFNFSHFSTLPPKTTLFFPFPYPLVFRLLINLFTLLAHFHPHLSSPFNSPNFSSLPPQNCITSFIPVLFWISETTFNHISSSTFYCLLFSSRDNLAFPGTTLFLLFLSSSRFQRPLINLLTLLCHFHLHLSFYLQSFASSFIYISSRFSTTSLIPLSIVQFSQVEAI